MKKILSLALCLMMVLSLCACESSGGGTTPEKRLVGEWIVFGAIIDDQTTTNETLISTSYATFDRDNTGVVTVLGNEFPLTWEYIGTENGYVQYAIDIAGEASGMVIDIDESRDMYGALCVVLTDDYSVLLAKSQK